MMQETWKLQPRLMRLCRAFMKPQKNILKDGKLPIMLGGEHSLTFAMAKACAEFAGEDFGVLILDAHFDLREEYRGFKHNHACVSRNILNEVTKNLVSIGIRSGPEEEWVFARENNLKYYTADDVESIGMVEVLKEALEWLDCSQLYLSLDMDAIDPAYAPGLGTPEPFGLNARDIRTAVRTLAPFTMGFDIVEIAPEYDSGQTAMLGAKIMREFIASHAKSRMNLGTTTQLKTKWLLGSFLSLLRTSPKAHSPIFQGVRFQLDFDQ